MNQSTIAPDDHLSDETLAVLVDGTAGPAVHSAAVSHLARCRRCMGAYDDAVRMRALWLRHHGELPAIAGAGPHAKATRREHVPAWVLAAASVVLVAGALGLPWAMRRNAGPALPPAVRASVEAASTGGLVLPGGEAGAPRALPSYRSDVPSTLATDAELESLRLRYEGGHTEGGLLYALSAGLVATGQLDLADDYVAEGLRRTPDSARLLVLAGVIADHRGEEARAIELLRRARATSHDDPTVLLDLGLLLLGTSRQDEGAALLREVSARVPGSPLAQRAQRELSRLAH